MSNIHRDSDASKRAATERAIKGRDIKSGAAKVRVLDSRRRRGATPPPATAVVTGSAACIDSGARDAMIAEAAYFRSAHRGFEPGHEVDDWLAAEAEIDAAMV